MLGSNRRRNFLILIALGSIVFWANTWGLSIYVLDEARNSACAMEMYERHDWVVPTFNGELRTDKPPMHYFFMQIAYTIFGVHPFAARFFSSLMGLLTVLSVYLFARKIFGERTAFLSALILLSSIQLIIQFHLAVPDPYLIFFLTFAMLSFYFGMHSGKKLYYHLCYVSLAFAMLTKGPVAIVFAGTIVFIFLLSQKKFSWSSLKEIQLIPGILLFTVIAAPWYLAVGYATHGEWLDQFFFKHNVGRFTSTMEGHKGFPLASLVIVVAALIPFSFFLPQATQWSWKNRKENPFALFCGIAAVVVVAFFAVSRTILPNYPEPAVPFVALLLGYFFNHVLSTPSPAPKLMLSAGIYLLIAILLPVAVYVGLQQDSVLIDLSQLSIWFLVLPAGALIGFYFIYKRNTERAIITYVSSVLIFSLIFFYEIYPQVDARNPVTQSISHMNDTQQPVVYYRDFNPAFVIALKKTLPKLSTPDEVKHYTAANASFYLVSQKRFLPELDSLGFTVVFEGRDLFERHTTVVLQKN